MKNASRKMDEQEIKTSRARKRRAVSLAVGPVLFGWDIPLRGWVQPPAMKNGDHLKVILLNSYFSMALRCPKNASLGSCSAQTMERTVAALMPTDNKGFFAILHFQNIPILMNFVQVPTQSWFGLIIVIVAEFL